MRRGLLLKSIKEKVEKNPSEPVRRVFDKAVEEDSGDSDEVPFFESVRSRIKRMRSKLLPAIPSGVSDVDITGEWGKTWKGKKFMTHLDNNAGIAVFTTKRFLKALQKADCLYVDGTFHTAPKPYMQFVTIHGKIGGFVVPLVFILSTGKISTQYRSAFRHLKVEVHRLTHQALQPRRVVCDFEKSLMIALEFEFPTSRLSGCYFHFTQSLWRRVQHVGLAADYRNDERLRKRVRKVMALGFLPTLLVRQNFGILRASRSVGRLITRFPKLNDWLQYVESVYVTRNAPFPTSIWNVYDRNCETRTNNHVEGLKTIKLNNSINSFLTVTSTYSHRPKLSI